MCVATIKADKKSVKYSLNELSYDDMRLIKDALIVVSQDWHSDYNEIGCILDKLYILGIE